ncbi:TPA: hypothetical protein KKX73_002940 [Legionella pneumophila]|uniref:hypothetical protein n=1 Tax=Fluoribacter gormanii TaxID=464 RepID=UPI0013EF5F7D|nr:hypothetical protein [Fluoribacter gormanii]HBD7504127.1 hypothetical protein [Legionella pneumophila]
MKPRKVLRALIFVASHRLKDEILSTLDLRYFIGVTQTNHHSASINTVIKMLI